MTGKKNRQNRKDKLRKIEHFNARYKPFLISGQSMVTLNFVSSFLMNVDCYIDTLC